jgi:hypothetical protein
MNKQDYKDSEEIDLINYKGLYFNDDGDKYTDPENGAHFHFQAMQKRLLVAAKQREIIDR